MMLSPDEISERIVADIRDKYLEDDSLDEFSASTPLIELGILNSLNMIKLLGFIRDDIGVAVPAREINVKNFKDVRSITALVCGIAELANSAK
ncbi:phosphopantetheine-binding protein [Nocardia sp. NPDC052566]|uniref:phosphopantetheine-binding protein n=1 Tax=Nocardia sp. NPDC052566 TaxID=3364330 RepID=UPI0037C69C4B